MAKSEIPRQYEAEKRFHLAEAEYDQAMRAVLEMGLTRRPLRYIQDVYFDRPSGDEFRRGRILRFRFDRPSEDAPHHFPVRQTVKIPIEGMVDRFSASMLEETIELNSLDDIRAAESHYRNQGLVPMIGFTRRRREYAGLRPFGGSLFHITTENDQIISYHILDHQGLSPAQKKEQKRLPRTFSVEVTPDPQESLSEGMIARSEEILNALLARMRLSQERADPTKFWRMLLNDARVYQTVPAEVVRILDPTGPE